MAFKYGRYLSRVSFSFVQLISCIGFLFNRHFENMHEHFKNTNEFIFYSLIQVRIVVYLYEYVNVYVCVFIFPFISSLSKQSLKARDTMFLKCLMRQTRKKTHLTIDRTSMRKKGNEAKKYLLMYLICLILYLTKVQT
jgi:hypothetical protein